MGVQNVKIGVSMKNFLNLCFLICLNLVALDLYADSFESPDALAGWTHEPYLPLDTAEGHGLVVSGKTLGKNSPNVADLDGDPSNGLEVVFVGEDARLYVYHADGSLFWQRDLPNKACTLSTKEIDRSYSSPTIGDLYGDGKLHIVLGYGGLSRDSLKCGGGVVAYRALDGKRRWVFNLQKFDRRNKLGGYGPTVFSTVALADTDGDGKMEVGFGAFVHYVFLLEFNGKVRWFYNAADTVWSSAAFADTNADGRKELIIGTDISKNDFLKPKTKDGGYVIALSTQKFSSKLRHFRDPDTIVWERYFDQAIFSSPVIAELIDSNPGKEVVIQSGCYFPTSSKEKNGKWIKILSLKTGDVLTTLNTEACSPSSPAVADVDQDGKLEILAVAHGNKNVGGQGQSKLMLFEVDNPTPVWSIAPKTLGQNDSYGGYFQSPVVADLDGNGSLEVLLTNTSGVAIFSALTGAALTCQVKECVGETLDHLLYTWKTVKNTPLVADVNLDGILDVFVGGVHSYSNSRGVMYAWTNLQNAISSDPGTHPINSAPWPMHRGNPAHTGVYGD